MTVAKKSNGVVKKNSGASLVDLGDGVGCIEFHSKMNSLGSDIVGLITQSLKPGGPGDNFDAFVITNDAANFSVGANLMLLLMSVQEEEWDDVDLAIRQFQGMTQAIKFSPKPVVAAPFGLCLGGGTEISLHAAARQPHAELYTGLVEVGRWTAARRRRVQGDAVARGRQRGGVARQSLGRGAGRLGRNDGGDEESVRDHRHGQGCYVGA